MPYDPNQRIDIFEIEREAQRLRAQAIADGAKTFAKWLRTRLHLKGGAVHHA